MRDATVRARARWTAPVRRAPGPRARRMSSAAISGQGPGSSWRNAFHRLVASIEELFRVAFGFRRGARPAQARRVQMKYTSVWAGRATKHGTELTRKRGWRAVPPALAEIGYGC